MNITLTGEDAMTAQKAITQARSIFPALDGISDEDILRILVNASLEKEASA